MIEVFLDSYLYDDTDSFDVDIDYYEDKVYDRFISTYKEHPSYIQYINNIDIDEYNIALSIKRRFDNRFGEFEFYGIIQFSYKHEIKHNIE